MTTETTTTQAGSFLSWVPLEEITADARRARPGRALLAFIAGAIFGVFWLAGKTFGVLFLAGAWCASAGKMGWRQARGIPLNQPSMEQVMAENAWLRSEIARLS